MEAIETRLTPELIRQYESQGYWGKETLLDHLDRTAAATPGQSVLDEFERLGYTEFRDRVDRFALRLLDLGFQKGDRLGVQLPNWIDFLVAVLGSARVGVIPVVIHVPEREAALQYILGLTEARAAVLPAVYRRHDFPAMYASLRSTLPRLRHLFAVYGKGPDAAAAPLDGSGAEPFAAACAGSPLSDAERSRLNERAAAVGPNDLFVFLFTSGTTGKPKGVMHTQNTLMHCFRQYMRLWDVRPGDGFFSVAPVSHLTAFGIGFHLAVVVGGKIALQDVWSPQRCVELVERERPRFVVGAPPFIVDLARLPDLDGHDLRSVRSFIYAGATCPVEVISALMRRAGWQVTAVYGWTEGHGHTVTAIDDSPEVVARTCGKPIPGSEGKLVGPDGREVPPGGQGEFYGRGPNLFVGYFKNPELTRRAFTEDGWFRSGDIMTTDEHGNYVFLARADDTINRGGVKIDPRELEEALYKHPDVAHAVVVGMPDERFGQRACLFLVPKPSARFTLEDVTRFLAGHGVAKYAWPERLQVLDALPMTFTGKIRRNVLRDWAGRLARGERLPPADASTP